MHGIVLIDAMIILLRRLSITPLLRIIGFIAVLIVTINNAMGDYVVALRMLTMFKDKSRKRKIRDYLLLSFI